MDQLDEKKNDVIKYFQRKSSLAHFLPALELSTNLKQVKPFLAKLKFWMEKLKELVLRDYDSLAK